MSLGKINACARYGGTPESGGWLHSLAFVVDEVNKCFTYDGFVR